jgi:hypothetical protein
MSATPTRKVRQALVVVWPAFLMASVLEMLVFAVVDPRALQSASGSRVELSPLAVYTIAFFVFWIVIAAAGAITQLLQRDDPQVSRPRR